MPGSARKRRWWRAPPRVRGRAPCRYRLWASLGCAFGGGSTASRRRCALAPPAASTCRPGTSNTHIALRSKPSFVVAHHHAEAAQRCQPGPIQRFRCGDHRRPPCPTCSPQAFEGAAVAAHPSAPTGNPAQLGSGQRAAPRRASVASRGRPWRRRRSSRGRCGGTFRIEQAHDHRARWPARCASTPQLPDRRRVGPVITNQRLKWCSRS